MTKNQFNDLNQALDLIIELQKSIKRDPDESGAYSIDQAVNHLFDAYNNVDVEGE